MIPISLGELVDKITILKIKINNITDPQKLENINKEYNELILLLDLSESDENFIELLNINQKLWEIEDKIRIKEKMKEFDSEFIELARAVYYTNDKRCEIKRKINIEHSSYLVEEKSYQDYELQQH